MWCRATAEFTFDNAAILAPRIRCTLILRQCDTSRGQLVPSQRSNVGVGGMNGRQTRGNLPEHATGTLQLHPICQYSITLPYTEMDIPHPAAIDARSHRGRGSLSLPRPIAAV